MKIRYDSAEHLIVSWISQTLFGNLTYTVRHGPIKGMKRKGGLGWLPEFLASDNSPEKKFWLGQDLSGLVVYDIGAFHGLFTLLFSRTASQVISYEPNSENHARLTGNIQVNGLNNVTVRKVALGTRREAATMVASSLLPGAAHIRSENGPGSFEPAPRVRSEQISVTTLDDDIREMRLPPPGFIKIDVEGGELAVLSGGRNTLLTSKPKLFLEMHGETMEAKQRNVAAVVASLHDSGYRYIRHVESGVEIGPSNSSVAARGHLYCRFG